MTQDKFIKSFDGTNMCYRYYKGEGTPIILIHGLTGSMSAWYKTYDHLKSKKKSVLITDLRGHGLSDKPQHKKDYILENFVKDIKKILDKEKIKKIILIGHCFGGIICLKFIEKYQNFIKKMILISTDYKPKKIINRFILKKIPKSKILKFFLPEYYHYKKERVDYCQFKKYDDWHIPRISKDCKFTSIKVICLILEEMTKINSEKNLKNIDIPVLIIHGEKDTVSNKIYALELNKKIQNSKLIILKDVNHVNHILGKKPKINRIIYDFIKTG